MAICTLPPDAKKQNFFLEPMNPILFAIQTPFWVALILATVMAGLLAWLIAIPALRLRDDYLAIATLGFGEIIRVVFSNTQSITNGAQGLIRIPTETSVWWSWGVALLMIVFMVRLVGSSFGRSLKAIREDEVAAEAMGINLYRTKITSFVIGSAMAGLGGGLLAGFLGSIDPKMFNFLYTVSYTHLDVYKRQEYKKEYNKEPSAVAALAFDAYLVIRDAMETVSYTHLDVYKRQLLGGPIRERVRHPVDAGRAVGACRSD